MASMAKEELTFDDIPNTVEDADHTQDWSSVLEEIQRCRSLYERRQNLKRQKCINIKPLYYEHMKKRDLIARYPVYKFICTYPKPSKKYDPCQHYGNIVLDRDILTKDEHLSYLAQPRRNFGRPLKPPRCMYQQRFLPNCTTRIETLAYPTKIRVEQTWHDYHQIFSVRHAANIRKMLQRPPIEYISIDKAITLIHEERRLRKGLKCELRKKCGKIKRKLLKAEQQQMMKVILALYEDLKDFLLNDKFLIDPSAMSSLSKIIEGKIVEFCDTDDTASSHVRQVIKTVAQNLAIWLEKFVSNCGFRNRRTEKAEQAEEICKPSIDKEFLLPVEDFISYHTPSQSGEEEMFDFVEEYEAAGEYSEGEQ